MSRMRDEAQSLRNVSRRQRSRPTLPVLVLLVLVGVSVLYLFAGGTVDDERRSAFAYVGNEAIRRHGTVDWTRSLLLRRVPHAHGSGDQHDVRSVAVRLDDSFEEVCSDGRWRVSVHMKYAESKEVFLFFIGCRLSEATLAKSVAIWPLQCA